MKPDKAFLTGIILLLATTAGAATYYVDVEDGNDSWNGLSRTFDGANGPWQHLPGTIGFNGSGWAALQHGDKAYVKGGTINKVQVGFSPQYYKGNLEFDSIQIIGGQYASSQWGDSMPVFDEEFIRTYGFWVGYPGSSGNTKGLTIDGFEIRNIKDGGVGAGFDPTRGSAAIALGGNGKVQYVTVRRSYLHDARRIIDDTGHGIETGWIDHFIIETNSIGPRIGTKCIEPYNSSYGIIRNNYISGCGDHGIALTRTSHSDIYNNVINYVPPQVYEPDYGISMSGSSGNDIWNNLIFRNDRTSCDAGQAWSMGMGMYTSNSDVRIVHNTLANFSSCNNAGSSTMMRVGDYDPAKGITNSTLIANNIFYKGANAAGHIQFAIRLNSVSGETTIFNDFFHSNTTENVIGAFDVNVWKYYPVSSFSPLTGHTFANNSQLNPSLKTGILPDGLDGSYHPKTDYFALTDSSPAQVKATGNSLTGDATHGFSADINKFALDISGNRRTQWSMGAYEFTNAQQLQNMSPDVSISFPPNAAEYTVPAGITIMANASDTDGTVSKVEFYNEVTLLGTDTNAPYSYTWSDVNAGTYTITARATDNQGASATSAPISLIVNTPGQPISDDDLDGVPNAIDNCPRTAMAARDYVNVFGCALPIATKFDIRPDFNTTDINGMQNLELGISQYGKISYSNKNILLVKITSGEDGRLNIDADLNISQNKITLNQSSLPQLNVPATITLYNTSFKNPKILKDGIECTSCSITGYDKGTKTLVFTVPGF